MRASLTIRTQASEPAGGVVATARRSTTVIGAGSSDPSATNPFSLTAPDNTTIDGGSVTITGDGTYSNPTTVLATQVGTYTWHASYAGDSLNNGAVDNDRKSVV